MALRLHLAPQAVHTLSHCSAALREQVQHELGALVAAPPRDVGGRRAAGGALTVLLHSGFRVCFQLDVTQGLLQLLEVRAPAEAA